jgi:hypothetical protein
MHRLPHYTWDVSGDEGDRTPDLVNAIHALSQLSYVPEVRAAKPHTGVSAGTAKPILGYILSQANRAGGKVQGRYFAAPSVAQEEPASSLVGRGHTITSDVTLRRVTAHR